MPLHTNCTSHCEYLRPQLTSKLTDFSFFIAPPFKFLNGTLFDEEFKMIVNIFHMGLRSLVTSWSSSSSSIEVQTIDKNGSQNRMIKLLWCLLLRFLNCSHISKAKAWHFNLKNFIWIQSLTTYHLLWQQLNFLSTLIPEW